MTDVTLLLSMGRLERYNSSGALLVTVRLALPI
jgi:hypothetical protein